MNQKPQSLWDESTSSEQQVLRPPKIKTTSNNSTSTPVKNEDNETPEKKFLLRAEAPEFIPGGIKPATARPQAQDRLTRIRNNPQNEPQAKPLMSESDLNRLIQIINSLIKYPGQFDDLLMVFMESACPYFNDVLATSEIVKLLVNNAIVNPSFCYNAVRLCCCIEQHSPIFRAELHLSCTSALQEHPNQQHVLIFLAEIFTQLPHQNLYAPLLIQSMEKLLEFGGEENIKTLCRSMKLAGYSLERHSKPAFDEVLSKLKLLQRTSSDSTMALVNSVINLKESNWGRSSEENSPVSNEFDHDCEEIVNGILYETDGPALSNEEQEFLAAHATEDYYIENDPEMDDEIEAAYEEFLKLSVK